MAKNIWACRSDSAGLLGLSMDAKLTSPNEIRRILAEHGIRPKKRLGQNFLKDANILEKIISAACLEADDEVLEIGPGLGTLTREAARLAKKVVCVETDPDMVKVLRQTLRDFENVKIEENDFLSLELKDFLQKHFGVKKCVALANLPYYITSPIIAALIDSKSSFKRMVLMVQKEVAQRLAAEAGETDYSAFGIFVNYHCHLEMLAKAPKTVFYPAPDVDSAIIRLVPRDEPAVKTEDEKTFFETVRAAFGKRRKTLLNALSSSEALGISRERAAAALEKAGINQSRRGETLTIQDFAKLSDAIKQMSGK